MKMNKGYFGSGLKYVNCRKSCCLCKKVEGLFCHVNYDKVCQFV